MCFCVNNMEIPYGKYSMKTGLQRNIDIEPFPTMTFIRLAIIAKDKTFKVMKYTIR